MISLICESTKTNYFEAVIAFFVIMTIIGFVLILVDKKRWNAHVARSDEMLEMRGWKKSANETVEGESENQDKEGKKKKSKLKGSEEYEYEGRIKNGALITIAILFGGIGELLAMIIFRHKWYSKVYKIGMPIIAAINFAFMFIIAFAVKGIGGPSMGFFA